MEILKVKLNETQTLIAYRGSKSEPIGTARIPHHVNIVDFKVGPNSEGEFIACSPDAAMALLAMLDRQEKPPTP